MNTISRRRLVYSLGSVAITPSITLTGCFTSEGEIVRYAVVAGTAAVSIGQVISVAIPPLGAQIIATGNALIAAAEAWQIGAGTEGQLINALTALKLILESIPIAGAGLVAALLPIAIAAINSIFSLLGKDETQEQVRAFNAAPNTWPPATIPHHFGDTPVTDFEKEWDKVVSEKHIVGAVNFGK